MLRVVVELHPYGQSDSPLGLVEMYIVNDASGTFAVSNYDVYLMHPDEGGRIIAHVPQHARANGRWTLVRRAIEALESSVLRSDGHPAP